MLRSVIHIGSGKPNELQRNRVLLQDLLCERGRLETDWSSKKSAFSDKISSLNGTLRSIDMNFDTESNNIMEEHVLQIDRIIMDHQAQLITIQQQIEECLAADEAISSTEYDLEIQRLKEELAEVDTMIEEIPENHPEMSTRIEELEDLLTQKQILYDKLVLQSEQDHRNITEMMITLAQKQEERDMENDEAVQDMIDELNDIDEAFNTQKEQCRSEMRESRNQVEDFIKKTTEKLGDFQKKILSAQNKHKERVANLERLSFKLTTDLDNICMRTKQQSEDLVSVAKEISYEKTKNRHLMANLKVLKNEFARQIVEHETLKSTLVKQRG